MKEGINQLKSEHKIIINDLMKRNKNLKEEYIALKEVTLALLEKYKYERMMKIAELSTYPIKASKELQREYEYYLDKINNKY